MDSNSSSVLTRRELLRRSGMGFAMLGLAGVLSDPAVRRVLVFTRTKRGCDRVARRLTQDGIPAQAIHGDKSQGNREKSLEGFRKGRIRVLVATDIAARGIDVDDITHVVNYEIPNVPETYVHRIGRTARAGAAGVAISLCSPEEREFLREFGLDLREMFTVGGEDSAKKYLTRGDGTQVGAQAIAEAIARMAARAREAANASPEVQQQMSPERMREQQRLSAYHLAEAIVDG